MFSEKRSVACYKRVNTTFECVWSCILLHVYVCRAVTFIDTHIPIFRILAKLSLQIFDILYVALFVVRMTKHFKTLHFRLVCLNSVTALIIVKMIEMTFQNQEGRLYCSQIPNINSSMMLQCLTVKEYEVRCK